MPDKQSWPRANALVYSVDWFDANRNDAAHYTVEYSYQVGEERYVGTFYDYITETDYLRRDDTIQIAYDPSNPSKSFYPDAHKDPLDPLILINRVLLGIIAVGGLIVWVLICSKSSPRPASTVLG